MIRRQKEVDMPVHSRRRLHRSMRSSGTESSPATGTSLRLAERLPGTRCGASTPLNRRLEV